MPNRPQGLTGGGDGRATFPSPHDQSSAGSVVVGRLIKIFPIHPSVSGNIKRPTPPRPAFDQAARQQSLGNHNPPIPFGDVGFRTGRVRSPHGTRDHDQQPVCRKAAGGDLGVSSCVLAQTGQFLDRLHRPGNVHDSNGATVFARSCFQRVRNRLPKAVLEARIDSAFFNEDFFSELAGQGVEFTASVPFARFPKLKGLIENRQRWRRMDDTWSYFEPKWTPDSWTQTFRILIVRQKKKKPTKGELQLDLFEPVSHEYEYSVMVTNKTTQASHVLAFHHGRDTQEGIFAEGKSQCQLDYIPVRKKTGNQIYCLAAMLAHNLTRELQMQATPPTEKTTAKRRPLWVFESLKTIRHRLVRRAGRLLYPQGRFTLSLGANEAVQKDFKKYLSPRQAC